MTSEKHWVYAGRWVIRPFGTVCPVSPRGTAPLRAVALDGIQDFTIRALILNFVGGMARNKWLSGESGHESRRLFKDTLGKFG